MVAVLDQTPVPVSKGSDSNNYSWRPISDAIRNIALGDDVQQNLAYLAQAREYLADRLLKRLGPDSGTTEEGIRRVLSAAPHKGGCRVLGLERVQRVLSQYKGFEIPPNPQHQPICKAVITEEVSTAAHNARPSFARMERAQVLEQVL